MGGNSNTTASNAIDDVMFSFFFFFQLCQAVCEILDPNQRLSKGHGSTSAEP